MPDPRARKETDHEHRGDRFPAEEKHERSTQPLGPHGGARRARGGREPPPDLAAVAVEHSMFRTTRHPMPDRERAVLATARPFAVHSRHGRIAAWRWGEGPVVILTHGWNGRGSQLRAPRRTARAARLPGGDLRRPRARRVPRDELVAPRLRRRALTPSSTRCDRRSSRSTPWSPTPWAARRRPMG